MLSVLPVMPDPYSQNWSIFKALVSDLFPAPEGDEACRGEGGAGPGGVGEGDERPAVLEAVPAAAAAAGGGRRLRRGQDAQRLDGALPPAQHLLRLPVHRQQPHLIQWRPWSRNPHQRASFRFHAYAFMVSAENSNHVYVCHERALSGSEIQCQE